MSFDLFRYWLMMGLTTGKKKEHYERKYLALRGISQKPSPVFELEIVPEVDSEPIKVDSPLLRALKKLNPYVFNGEGNELRLYRNGELIENDRVTHVNISVNGNNNFVSVHIDRFEARQGSLNLMIEGDNNRCVLEYGVRGNWNIAEYGENNSMEIGQYSACGQFDISLHSNKCKIGDHCMISDKVELWTDGHAVIDAETRELLNYPKSPILIGDYVWLGRRVILTKGAQVPSHSIVAIGAIVTKAFTEPNVILAGVPARVVKRGIAWDGRRPVDYQKAFEKEQTEKN